jgi:hypothetical protein
MPLLPAASLLLYETRQSPASCINKGQPSSHQLPGVALIMVVISYEREVFRPGDCLAQSSKACKRAPAHHAGVATKGRLCPAKTRGYCILADVAAEIWDMNLEHFPSGFGARGRLDDPRRA